MEPVVLVVPEEHRQLATVVVVGLKVLVVQQQLVTEVVEVHKMVHFH